MSEKSRNKWPIVNCQLSTLILIVGMLIACESKQNSAIVDTYICPMHPTVVSEKQGVCPVCNMDLVRKARPGEEVKVTEDLVTLLKSPNEHVVSSIKTTKGEFASQTLSAEANGVVTYDLRNRFTIPARIGGRLEKVFLKYPYQLVRKGQIVAEIYSAELATAQQELLWLLQQNDNDQEIQQAKDKLVLLGFTEQLLANLIQTKAVQYRFPIISPVSGFVVMGEQPQPTMKTQANNMAMQTNAVTTKQPVTSAYIIKEGDYVNAGATLFTVVDVNSLLIELSVSAAQSRNLSVGDTINLKLKQTELSARVGFIQPFYNTDQEFALVRIYVSGADLKIGELVAAQWSTKTSAWMWLPRQAVVDLGTEAIVFVKERGSFVAKQVVIQSSSPDKVALSGLSSMDEIALSAQFLVDSEGFIRTSK